MKQALFTLLTFGVLLFAAPVLQAQEVGPDTLFTQAQQAYDAGQYARAVELYEGIEAQGHAEPEVLFNKGNALYRLGHIGPAVASYRRAQYARPRDPDIQANLSIVQQQVGAVAPEQSAWDALFGYLSQREWQRLGLVAYWLAGCLGALYFLWAPTRWLRRIIGLALMLSLCSSLGWWHWRQLEQHPEVAIQGQGVQALFAPMVGAMSHFPLPEGSLVSLRDKSGSWRKIAVGRQEGWIPAETCDQISLH